MSAGHWPPSRARWARCPELACAEAPGRRVTVPGAAEAPRAHGQPPGERQGISICERSRVPFMPDVTVTHNSWRSRQQAPPQYGNSHARDRSRVKRSRHPLSTHTASVALLCACSMPPRVVPAPLHPREPPVPAGGPRRHYARPAHQVNGNSRHVVYAVLQTRLRSRRAPQLRPCTQAQPFGEHHRGILAIRVGHPKLFVAPGPDGQNRHGPV